MAYYLTFDGVDDYVTVSIPASSETNWGINFGFRGQEVAGSNRFYTLAGRSANARFEFELEGRLDGSRNLVIRTEAITEILTLNGASSFDLDVFNDIYLKTDGVDLWVEVNGVETDRIVGYTRALDASIDFIGRITGSINAEPFDLYYFNFYENGVVRRNYNPTSSGGTGLILPDDSVNADNGALLGYDPPNDDSQWVFYDAGGGGLVITSIAIASGESFGTPTFTTGVVTLSPTAIATAEALGNPTLSQGATFINPLTINTEEFIGVPVVTPQGVIITPTAIPTGASVGNPDVSVGLTLVFPEQIFTEEFVGEPQLEMLLKQIFPTGIITAQNVGRPLVLGGDSIVIPIESRVTWNAVANYLRSLVFKGADNDVIMAWMRSEGFEEAYNDNWDDYLLSEGYLTGSQADRYAAWRRGEVGIADPWILTSGSWDDSRIWVDTATWKDN